MRYLLKIQLKALAQESKYARQAEQHYLECYRKLKGWYSKKHKKGEPKPVAPEVKENPKSDEYQDEHYAKFWNLHHHRVTVIRKEARYTHLVDTFLRGKPYEFAEASGTHSYPNFELVMELANDYTEDGDNAFKEKFLTWQESAETFLSKNAETRTKNKEKKTQAA